MMGKINRSLALCVVCMLFVVFLFEGGSSAFADGVVAIVNTANDVSEISLSDLKKMYLMKKRKWPDGHQVMVWLPPSGSEEMNALLANALNVLDEADLKKYYLTAVFQQIISGAPGSVLNGREAAQKVAGLEGGVAIVKESDVLGIPGIKIFKVDGL